MKTDQQMIRWALEESPEPVIKNPYLRLAFRGNFPPSMQTGVLPIEFDQLSPQEQQYYQNPPFSTHPDFLGAKGGSAQLVQPGPGRPGYQGKEPSPYLNDKKFLKFLNENYPNQPRDKLNTAYEAYERMLLKKNKTIGTKGLMEALGEDNPYSKDAIDRAFGNVGDRTIKKNMSSSQKSKINQANKLRKIIVDTIGEPKSYADEMKKYRYLKREVEKFDLKPVEGQGFKKYFELDNKKIKALNKALNKNYQVQGLRANTIDNIYNLFDDETFMKSLNAYKGGEVNLGSDLFKKVFKPGLAGERSYAYMMLGRALRGEIELEGIKKNKALGDKIIKSIAHDKNLARYGQMDKAALRWAKFQMAKHFDDPKANYDTITRSISKAFRDVGISKKLGYTVVTDEIFPARTGQLTIGKGSGAYNQIVQFIDKRINEGAKRSFDGKASTRYQEIIKARKDGNWTRVNELVNTHKKAVKDFYVNNPEAKGKVKLTQLDYNPKTHKFATPTKIYGKGVIPSKIQKGMDKFYRKTGLSLDVGSAQTLEGTAKRIEKLKKGSFSNFKKGMYQIAKDNGIGKACGVKKAEGGRIGFASGTQSFDDCMRGAIADETRIAKGMGAKARQAGQRLLGVAKWAGKWIGLIDVPIEFAFALPALLRGDIEGAKRHTTFGLFGWGETQMEQMKETNPEAYKFLKHDNDVMNWQQAEWQLEHLNEAKERLEKSKLEDGYGSNELNKINTQIEELLANQTNIEENYIGYKYTDEVALGKQMLGSYVKNEADRHREARDRGEVLGMQKPIVDEAFGELTPTSIRPEKEREAVEYPDTYGGYLMKKQFDKTEGRYREDPIIEALIEEGPYMEVDEWRKRYMPEKSAISPAQLNAIFGRKEIEDYNRAVQSAQGSRGFNYAGFAEGGIVSLLKK